jgi:hypothetical protein
MRLTSGPEQGRKVELRLGATGLIDPDVDPGDKILLVLIFVAVTLLFARLRGALSRRAGRKLGPGPAVRGAGDLGRQAAAGRD